MQVYEISVRFMRRIQVREYEPAEAEVTVKAQLADGEKAESIIGEAFKLASGEVHVSLGLAKDTKLPARARGQQTTEVSATTAKAPDPKPAPSQSSSDIPGEGAPAAKTTAAAPAPSGSDIPDDDKPAGKTNAAPPADGGDLSPADLSKWIGDQVRNGKVTSQSITGLYPKFGISRFADLKPEKCAEAKREIEALIAAQSNF